MTTVRESAVAGRFYPADASDLKSLIRTLLDQAESHGPPPKAIIAPHAGYVYSGPVAASAYARLQGARDTIDRVILLGPSHYVPVPGLATTSADAFSTPLGLVPVDVDAVREILAFPQVEIRDEAHSPEHSLDVHLPFLQEVLRAFRLVPLVVGRATIGEVAEVLDFLWGGPETLLAISSDLSHFHDYETARAVDRETSRFIEQLRPTELIRERACGYRAIGGLLKVARERGLKVKTLDLRNSGDTAGGHDRVVGYGAYVVES